MERENLKKAILASFGAMNNHLLILKKRFTLFADYYNLLFKLQLNKTYESPDELRKTYLQRISKIVEFIEIVENVENELNSSDLSAKLSDHYLLFLQREIVNYTWNNSDFYYTPQGMEMIKSNLINFEKKEDVIETEVLLPNNRAFIQQISSQFQSDKNYFVNVEQKINSITVFSNFKNINNNVVIVGANGSGKSTFTRQISGKLSDNVSIISAQHLLVIRPVNQISFTNQEINNVRNFQTQGKLGSDPNLISLLQQDFTLLVSALYSEHLDRASDYYDNKSERIESVLNKTINIWNKIIVHRELKLINKKLSAYDPEENSSYDINLLSDGEKAVFYYIGHVLLSKPNSYIIVDEPEIHLHLSISGKLWDILEKERDDCKFIYITHDLEFAASRDNKTLLWNKRFISPSTWKVEPLPEDNYIPEQLMMEIVGSRRLILFCEGTKSSYDYKLYRHLFNNMTVIPVGGHLDVVSITKAYNKSSEIYGKNSYGIIDGDFHDPEQLKSWAKENIYALQFNEIENFLCEESILEFAKETWCSPDNSINSFKDKFFSALESDKLVQVSTFVLNKTNNHLKENLLNQCKSLDSIKDELDSLIKSLDIDKLYDEKLKEIEKILSERNYSEAIKICNFKGKLFSFTNEISKDYKVRIIKLLSKNDKLLDELRTKYFPNLKKINESNVEMR